MRSDFSYAACATNFTPKGAQSAGHDIQTRSSLAG